MRVNSFIFWDFFMLASLVGGKCDVVLGFWVRVFFFEVGSLFSKVFR